MKVFSGALNIFFYSSIYCALVLTKKIEPPSKLSPGGGNPKNNSKTLAKTRTHARALQWNSKYIKIGDSVLSLEVTCFISYERRS